MNPKLHIGSEKLLALHNYAVEVTYHKITTKSRYLQNYFILLVLYFCIKDCSCISNAVVAQAASLTSDQPGWTITIEPMHTGAEEQQSALMVVFLMSMVEYSSLYECCISHDPCSLLT